MLKPIISIDIDDVIADTTEATRLWANDVTGRELSESDYKIEGEYWDYYEHVWYEAGLDHLVKFDDFVPKMSSDQSFITPIAGVKEILERYSDTFRYVLITSRNEREKDETVRWFEDRFDSRLFEGIYFTGDRHTDGYKSKGELSANLGAILHIDDNIDYCRSVMDQGIKCLLFGEYGWNLHQPKDIPHARNWKEVGEYLERTKF